MPSFVERSYHYIGDNPDTFIPPDDTLSDATPEKTEEYMAIVSRVAQAVIARVESNGRIPLVGINGVDTSGKTEFSKTLATTLSSEGVDNIVVHTDDFMHPKQVRRSGTDPIDNYYNYAIDFAQIESGLLVPIHAEDGVDVTFDTPHPANDDWRLHHRYSVESPDPVITEGVFLFREGMTRLFDLRVFLDIPLDQVLERARQRDVAWGGEEVLEKYRQRYIPTQQRYLEQTKPADSAHIVIDSQSVLRPTILKDESHAR